MKEKMKNPLSTEKLLLLYIFDLMNTKLTESTVLDICTSSNNWIGYMDCLPMLEEHVDNNFLFKTKFEQNFYYSITPEGRECISFFYEKIPHELRNEIAEFVKKNRLNLKRRQDYFSTYQKNEDGTYNITLRIIEDIKIKLEIKMNVEARKAAKIIHDKWKEKAASVYISLNDILLEN